MTQRDVVINVNIQEGGGLDAMRQKIDEIISRLSGSGGLAGIVNKNITPAFQKLNTILESIESNLAGISSKAGQVGRAAGKTTVGGAGGTSTGGRMSFFGLEKPSITSKALGKQIQGQSGLPISSAVLASKRSAGGKQVAQNLQTISDRLNIVRQSANKLSDSGKSATALASKLDSVRKSTGAAGQVFSKTTQALNVTGQSAKRTGGFFDLLGGKTFQTMFRANALVSVLSGRLLPPIFAILDGVISLNPKMIGLGTAFAGVSTAAKAFSAAIKFVGTVTKLTTAVLGLTAAVTGFITALSVKKLAQFNRTMTETKNILLGTDQTMEGLSKRALKLSRDLGVGPQKAAEALQKAVTSGARSVEQQMAVTESAIRLANLRGADFTNTVNLLTTVTEAFGFGAKETNEAAQQLFATVSLGNTTIDNLATKMGPVVNVAGAMGFKFKEIASATAVLSRSNKNATKALIGIKNILNRVNKLSETNKEKLESMGVAADAATIRTIGLRKWMMQLNKALGNNTEAIANIFPNIRGLTAAIQLITKKGQQWTDTMKEMDNAGKQFGEATDNINATITRQLDIFKSSISRLQLLFAGGFGQAFNSVLNFTNNIIAVVENWVKQNISQIQRFFNSFLAPLVQKFKQATSTILLLLSNSEKSWPKKINGALSAIMAVVKPGLEFIKDVFLSVWTAIAQSLAQIILSGFKVAMRVSGRFLATKGLKAIVVALIGFGPAMLSIGARLGKLILLAFSKPLTKIGEVLLRTILTPVEALFKALREIAGVLGLDFLSKSFQRADDAIDDVQNSVDELEDTAMSTFSERLEKGVDLVDALTARSDEAAEGLGKLAGLEFDFTDQKGRRISLENVVRSEIRQEGSTVKKAITDTLGTFGEDIKSGMNEARNSLEQSNLGELASILVKMSEEIKTIDQAKRLIKAQQRNLASPQGRTNSGRTAR